MICFPEKSNFLEYDFNAKPYMKKLLDDISEKNLLGLQDALEILLTKFSAFAELLFCKFRNFLFEIGSE